MAQAVLSARSDTADPRCYWSPTASFQQVPAAPFAYWAGGRVLSAFSQFPGFECESRIARQGLATADDFRFVRLWTEQRRPGQRWLSFAKGGAYSPFYADVYLAVKWSDNGAEIRRFDRAYIRNEDEYRRPGLTWPRRTQKGLSVRAMPAGCIFADKGPATFVADDDPQALLALLAVTNSQAFRALVALQMAFGSYEVGVIQRTPVPELNWEDQDVLSDWARRAWSLNRALDTAELTSHAFVLPALLQVHGNGTLAERANAWSAKVAETEQALADIQSAIDERCFNLYGFAPEDREQAMGGSGADQDAPGESDGLDDEELAAASVDLQSLAASLVDWLVGVAFGRFDVRLATGECQPPAEPDPFDPLPICSPGMLVDDEGLPAERAPEGYRLDLPPNGLLVDDPGLDGDLPAAWDVVRRVRLILDVAFGERATDIEAELCELLGVRDLRSYIGRPAGFFAEHLSHYSKSRRKAPIYWPLSTASGSYTVWVYYPRLTEDTLYSVIHEHISPQIAEVETRLAQLDHERTQTAGRDAARRASKAKELAELLDELRALRGQIQEIAALPYKPSLDDGVQLTAAPLHQLFAHRPWRTLLEKTWRELRSGQYDWAHLAYAIWPERVQGECQTDRSLAIAHGFDATDAVEG